MTVAAIGLAVLLIALAVTLWLRSNALRLTTEREPAARASTQALLGIQRSLAELGGWIVLGDEVFKQRRSSAWRHQVEPSLAELKALQGSSRDLERMRLGLLVRMLEDLRALQAQIEEIPRRQDEDEIRDRLAQRIEPTGRAILEAIEGIVEEELKSGGNADERRTLHVALNDFQNAFTFLRGILPTVVASADHAVEDQFFRMLEATKEQLQGIAALSQVLTDRQAQLLSRLQDNFPTYEAETRDLILSNNRDVERSARDLMAEEVVPLARRVTRFLHGVSVGDVAMMQVDAALVTAIANVASVLLVVLIVGLVFAAGSVSRRGAEQITQPLQVLARATQQLAAGEAGEEIPVKGNDEIAELTRTFNSMRRSLNERTAQLRETADSIRQSVQRLSSATSDLLSAAGQQVAGCEAQVVDLARTDAKVTKMVEGAEGVVDRARALAESAEWAVAVGQAGRKSVEVSVTGMRKVAEQVQSISVNVRGLSEQAKAIGEIVAALDEFAEQTDRLVARAPWDSTSAARVVEPSSAVREIQQLAERSMRASAQVRTILHEIERAGNSAALATEEGISRVNVVLKVIGRADDTIKTLADIASEADQLAARSAASAAQQAKWLAEIQQSVRHISQVTQQSFESTRNVERVARDLSSLGEELRQQLDRLPGEAPPEP
jgi:methyl-accepting chemotaxis protein